MAFVKIAVDCLSLKEGREKLSSFFRRVAMVAIHPRPGGQEASLTLTANQSMSWQQNIMLFGCVAAFSLMMTVVMVLLGAWLVVPFVGLELAALAVGLYITSLQASRWQHIHFNRDTIAIETGRYRLEHSVQVSRAWVVITAVQPSQPGSTGQVWLSCHGQQVRLGAFLNHDDLQKLMHHLEAKGLMIHLREV
ncbi:DUF2244 domain-containing protein [Zooshikella ganghwensis]|uniref:DUF2244 domain-containing protein n=2 Tax=Zooshikella ganghwensis TaxID=202772 RepID=A0A4P9VM88_9GAMM|nr:DUF2244 domain-containing protein [Zooshikella ganghwensis]RDH43220.1 DUF2244 domain-containing protein [Zooshikella ganghwensis]